MFKTEHGQKIVTKAALLPIPQFGGHGELQPFLGHPEPSFLVELAVSPGRMISGVFGLLPESRCVVHLVRDHGQLFVQMIKCR